MGQTQALFIFANGFFCLLALSDIDGGAGHIHDSSVGIAEWIDNQVMMAFDAPPVNADFLLPGISSSNHFALDRLCDFAILGAFEDLDVAFPDDICWE